MSGEKILQGLKDAVEGNIATVTIDGVRWFREDFVKQRFNLKVVLSPLTQELNCDPVRTDCYPETRIYVRAKRSDKWESVDIGELDRESLMIWLRSRGGDNPWAESTVALLLGHPPQ